MYPWYPRITAAFVVVLLCATILLAGCTAPSASTTPATASATPALPENTPATPAPPATSGMTASSPAGNAGGAPGGPAVAIENFSFVPAAITVPAGTTVTWTNLDTAPHTVTSTGSSAVLDSPTLHKGDTFRYTFQKAGTYPYICTIHPFMTGSVIVTSS